MLVKPCANFYPNPKKSNVQETFFLLCFFLFNIWISQRTIHRLPWKCYFSSYNKPIIMCKFSWEYAWIWICLRIVKKFKIHHTIPLKGWPKNFPTEVDIFLFIFIDWSHQTTPHTKRYSKLTPRSHIHQTGKRACGNRFSRDHYSADLFSRGPFSQGIFFPGTFFSGIVFREDFFSEDVFSGDFVSGNFFPGEIFWGPLSGDFSSGIHYCSF